MAQSKLEEIAIEIRDRLKARNIYNDIDANNYSATHTRALSDSKTPVTGKGTGVFLDTFNGGGDLDINGAPNSAGSGRKQNLLKNEFNPQRPYDHPDTNGNVGQVVIE